LLLEYQCKTILAEAAVQGLETIKEGLTFPPELSRRRSQRVNQAMEIEVMLL
jgi:hypothetical protein